jgi:hypothetical protein
VKRDNVKHDTSTFFSVSSPQRTDSAFNNDSTARIAEQRLAVRGAFVAAVRARDQFLV